MKKIPLLVLPLLLCGCASSEVAQFGSELGLNLLWSASFVSVVVFVIFEMNKRILHRHGGTNKRLCSIVGIVVIPLLFVGGVGIRFGFGVWPVSIAVVFGLIIGWFSYVIDELLLDAWENRETTVPLGLGIVMATYMTAMLFAHVWLEGDMYVARKACVNRVVVERYTQNTHVDDKGNVSYSYDWEYESHADRSSEGWELPAIIEGQDYVLGTGALGETDRIRREAYYFIGGHFFSEKDNVWRTFRWLRLGWKIDFEIGEVQRVQSDYFGHPIRNSGIVPSPLAYLPERPEAAEAFRSSDVPGPTMLHKSLETTWTAAKLMFVEEEYRDFLWAHVFLGGTLVLVAVVFPGMRRSILLFVISASVVVFIVMLMAAARTGNVGSLFDSLGRKKFRGGGGRSGGGGASGRY